MEVTIPVPGGEIWAEDAGDDRTPVVLVNPGWSTAGIWSPLMDLLADRFRLIRYDDRGVGRSPAPAVPFTRLADLRAVLDHTGAGPAVVVGSSSPARTTCFRCGLPPGSRTSSPSGLAEPRIPLIRSHGQRSSSS